MPPSVPQRTARQLIEPVVEELDRTKRVNLSGVSANARPWLAAGLIRAGAGPLLWLLPEEGRADQAARSARFFLGDFKQDPGDPFSRKVVHFPLHQDLPYDDLSPDRFAVADRLALLFRLVHGSTPDLIVASASSLMQKSMPWKAVDEVCLLILKGELVDQTALSSFLARAGYIHVPLVEDPGSFAVRGGIVDIFSPLLPLPVRIELLGDEVESIRAFDPDTQRTVSSMDSVYLGPVREILQAESYRALAIEGISRRADEIDLPSHRLLNHKRALRDGLWFFGIESFLPAFYPSLDSLFAYLPANTGVLIDDPGEIESAAEGLWQRAVAAHDEALHAGSLVFPPDSLLLSPSLLDREVSRRRRLTLGLAEEESRSIEIRTRDVRGLRERIQQEASGSEPLGPLVELVNDWRTQRLRPFLVASRSGRARELAGMLRRRNLPTRIEEGAFEPDWAEQDTPTPPVRIVSGELTGGFYCPAASVGFLPDADIFGKPVRRAERRPSKAKVEALKPGDWVVHVDFGIGRFEGMHKLEVAGSEADYLLLSYRGGDRLYLPVTRMNLVERYQGGKGPAGKGPVLSKLGTKAWERTKQRVREALLEMADQLIRLEASRRSARNDPVRLPEEEFGALEASFPFEETPDQHRSIREVVDDIVSPRVMDRLVCGDVGFGKTEVGIRAAYLNALNGRQTAVLVPTTILALQHLATFRARLEDRAVTVEMMSRLVRPAEQKRIARELAEGSVDVVIGTHRLLKEDIGFRSLGLLIIDEEHRFGVRHKERLKELKSNVDVLTMTATPLPRTLQMSLSGLRDISVIQTPPPGRRSIRTIVTRFSRRVVAEAIRRELGRGGQVFFLHNWIRSLPAMKRFVQKVVPEARCGVAHGRMNERELEGVMTDFVRREIDVLVCTSIIESGLDIPSANTIIINRADFFGLAQLHQIRGRVGRSVERAYAYLLIPGLSAVTRDARRRLEVLSDLSEVGSGYRIAAEDLEIRGAGNLLGKAQSGHIAAVGFDLYGRLLERAVAESRGQAPNGLTDPEISLPVAGLLPDDYVPELDQRLSFYARLSRAKTEEEVIELEQEIVDRYGAEPHQVETLCDLMRLKSLLRKAGVLSLEAKGDLLLWRFSGIGQRHVNRMVQLVQEQAERVTLDPDGTLQLRLRPEERQNMLETARGFASRLIV